MRKGLLAGLVSLLAVAALGVGASSSSAAACRVLVYAEKSEGQGVGCNNPPGVTIPQNIRAGTDAPEGFGTDALAVNTKGGLRFCATSAVLGKLCNSNPTGYAFFGLKVDKNPVSSATKCESASGWVPWADVQHASPSAVFSGDVPAKAWTFTVESDSKACPEVERAR
jgi:hypothetical protein